MRGSRQLICGGALVATVCASALIAAPVAAPAHSAISAKPHALKLLINGKRLPITSFSGPDRYSPIKPGLLRVKARWQGSLTGTGYKVVISTIKPTVTTYRTCSTGTTCLVRKRVPIRNGEEMSWVVRVMKIKYHYVKVLSGFMVCLAANTTPS